jgi:hypothetical protein
MKKGRTQLFCSGITVDLFKEFEKIPAYSFDLEELPSERGLKHRVSMGLYERIQAEIATSSPEVSRRTRSESQNAGQCVNPLFTGRMSIW